MSKQTEAREKPDYEIAREELAAWYAESGLECEISAPRAGVDYKNGQKGAEDAYAWPHVAFTLIFKRETVSVSQEWRQGIGIGIDWKAARKQYFDGANFTGRSYTFAKGIDANGGPATLNTLAAGKTPAAKYAAETAAIAAVVATFQGVKPSPAEVLASMAQDGAALLQTFEDWASEYGYDTDSREAERTYNACADCGRNLRKLLSAADIDKLAEWAGRL